MMRRLAGGLVVFLGLAWLVPARAQACSCVMPPAPKEALKQSDAVFEGKVLAVANDPAAHRDTVKFEVTRVWKGELSSRAEVTTIDIDSMCGYSFAVGTAYVVYASGAVTQLSTGLCTRTKASADAKEDLKALGAGKVPPAGAPEPAAPEPAAPVEPVKPVEPVQSVEPVKSVEPAAPAPVAPTEAKGCAVAGGGGAGLVWIGVLGLRRRRITGR